MKTKIWSFLTFLILFTVGWTANAETVSHTTLRNGAIRLQIQKAVTGGAYEVRLEDVKTGQGEKVSKFSPDSASDTLTSETKIKKQGVYRVRLFRGGVEVPLQGLEFNVPDIINVENAKVDRRDLKVSWKAPRSSLVRVNAILNNGMKVDTIASWHFTSNQEQSGGWDFKDKAKVRNYREHPNLQVYIQYIPLPDNLLVVGRPSFAEYQQVALFKDLPLPSGDNEIVMEALTKQFRSVPELPGQSIPVVRSGTPFRVKLDPKTKGRIGNKRYEIMFYADGEFIHEESEGADPYTFLLPELPRTSGLIYFSANLADYAGNSGTHTLAAWYDADAD